MGLVVAVAAVVALSASTVGFSMAWSSARRSAGASRSKLSVAQTLLAGANANLTSDKAVGSVLQPYHVGIVGFNDGVTKLLYAKSPLAVRAAIQTEIDGITAGKQAMTSLTIPPPLQFKTSSIESDLGSVYGALSIELLAVQNNDQAAMNDGVGQEQAALKQLATDVTSLYSDLGRTSA